MGKQVAQGTRHESSIRTVASSIGRNARRTAKTGRKHEADVIIEGADMRPAVAWKWMIVTGRRRKSVRLVAIPEDHYWELVALDTEHRYGWAVQCKSTQRLSVGATLLGLIDWLKSENRI